MKIVNSLNKHWLFAPVPYAAKETHTETTVNIPHTVKELPIDYFDEKSYQFQSHYIKHFQLPAVTARSFIRFEGVMTYCRVTLNGHYLGEHKGGYTAFMFEVTEYVTEGDNELLVEVDSTERSDVPPFGYTVDYLAYGGIYRDVDLLQADPTCITLVKTDTSDCLGDKARLKAIVRVDAQHAEKGLLKVTLQDGELTAEISREAALEDGANDIALELSDLEGIQLWDTENPHLYTLTVEYTSESSRSTHTCRVGFRHAQFTNKGFFLNGKQVKIFGLNRHQDFPVIGYAAPKRLQRRDADILKNELSLNLVRTSHYPQSKYFLDRCDEIGLLVFEEIPGWQHVGDEAWQEVSKQNVREMIEWDCNHPAIVLWGVRINESGDYDDFYKATNELAHRLDPSRQTGGVRCHKNSHLFEDVYTFNDFSFDGTNTPHQPQQSVTGLSYDVPYLVTEFCGHTYPTKSFDQEERTVEYAQRFAKIMNSVHGDNTISGAIGWCAFDYHTHRDFGSGNRLCHHGVMDMFRLPKMAAGFFKSQKSPAVEPILEPATRWTVGDRNGGGIEPIIMYTNCDYVEVEVNGKDYGKFYPDRENFANLAHPPVVMSGLNVAWGGAWGDGVFKGYINDECVIVKEMTANALPSQVQLLPDDTAICADETDMTRVVVKVVNEKGTILPFWFKPVELHITGGADIVGDTVISTIGGVYAFWIKSNGRKEDIHITAQVSGLPKAECTIGMEE